MILTRNGALCDSTGTLGFKEFEACMREQIRFYAQRKLSESLVHDSFTAPELAQIGAIKVILHELLRVSELQKGKYDQESKAVNECIPQIDNRSHSRILAELQILRAELHSLLGKEQNLVSDSLKLKSTTTKEKNLDFEIWHGDMSLVPANAEADGELQLLAPLTSEPQKDFLVSSLLQPPQLPNAGPQSNITATAGASAGLDAMRMGVDRSAVQTLNSTATPEQNGSRSEFLPFQQSSTPATCNYDAIDPQLQMVASTAMIMANVSGDTDISAQDQICSDSKNCSRQQNGKKVNESSPYSYVSHESQREELLKEPGPKFKVGFAKGEISTEELKSLQLYQDPNMLPLTGKLLNEPASMRQWITAGNMKVSSSLDSATRSSSHPKMLQYTVQSLLGITNHSTASASESPGAGEIQPADDFDNRCVT
jgi:hypothetical protein